MEKKKFINSDITFDIVNYALLGFFTLLVLYPLYFILIASISTPAEVLAGNVWVLPKGINFDGYKRIFNDEYILKSYANTFLYTGLGTLISICLTMTIAYVLSIKTLSIRKVLIFYVMFTMYFNGGLIPTYMLANTLGLVNKWQAMVTLGVVNVFNVIIAKTFLENSIPHEMFEAATIDGCDHFKYFLKFVLPLSKPVIAVLVLYYGIENWNGFFKALIYLNDKELYPLQLILRSLLVEVQVSADMIGDIETLERRMELAELIKYGVIVIATVPMLILYPFVQKYFAKGVMIGAVKG